MHFITNEPEFDQKSEEEQNSYMMKQETNWEQSPLPAVEQQQQQQQQQKRQRRVHFDDKIHCFYYDITCEDHSEIKYNRFIKELWRKHNEVSKQIEQFSLLQHNHVPPKQQIMKLISIYEKLQHQEKRVINCLSGTPEPLAYSTHVRKEEMRLQEEEDEKSQGNTPNIIQGTEKYKDKLKDENGEQPVIIKAMTTAQKTVLAATEKSSMPHIMTELEIIRKDIDTTVSTAIQNQHCLATQLTNDNAKTKELLKLTSSKRINEERKWQKIIQRVGNQRAEEMKSYIKEIDEEAQLWWKEREQKLSLAENLMITVNKEQSASCRIQMVTQRPELSREIVLVEAAKILSFIKVKQPQKNRDFDQWLNEQHWTLTLKMNTAQADSVMQEVYNKLATENNYSMKTVSTNTSDMYNTV